MKKLTQTLVSALILIAAMASAHAETILQDTNGKATPISELKGKWVVINYWAHWCDTCVHEIPELNRFYLSHKNDPVVFYGVNYTSTTLSKQKYYIKKFKIDYPNLTADPAQVLNLGEISGVPVTFIINPEGKLVKTLYGGQTAKTLNKVLAG